MADLLADVSPATLRIGPRARAKLRMFVWEDRAEGWGMVPGADTPVLLYVAALTGIDRGKSPQAPARSRPWTLTTTGGDVWKVERGCTCSGQVPAALAALKPTREAADVDA